jgi:hyperosmotically inducible protein
MKKNIAYLFSTIVCVACVGPVLAVDNDSDQRERTHDKRSVDREYRAAAPTQEREALGKIVKASEVIGRPVHNAHNEMIGSVQDLATDLKTGRIVYVLVDTKAGADPKTIAVPPGALKCQHADDKTYALEASKQRLKDAPNFEMPERATTVPQDKIAEVYRYYNQTPYFLDEVKRTPRYAPLVGPVLMASKVIGLPVQNHQDQKLGAVENLMVNLESGRVAHVIVSSGGFLGLGDDLSVVPPASFTCDAKGDRLILDASKETLAGAPRFSQKSWPDFSDPEYSTTVYRAYKVDPYFSPHADADNTALNVRDRDSKELTPLDQGSSEADVEITRKIRRELVADDGFSVNARNVKIITKNGQVTLRGPVNSMEEKRRIAEIVNRFAANATVNNQLEVKSQTNQ